MRIRTVRKTVSPGHGEENKFHLKQAGMGISGRKKRLKLCLLKKKFLSMVSKVRMEKNMESPES